MTVLNPADRGSETWKRILSHLQALKQNLLEDLAKPQDAERTAHLRGQIALCNRLIALDTERDFAAH